MIACTGGRLRRSELLPPCKIPTLVGDSAWEPLLGTPPHPEYPSAHACFSGAAEAVLRGELKTDSVQRERHVSADVWRDAHVQ